ncbi:MAG: hypothetical protein QME07_01030 [bacterium]|nr:hypothetical protein [bacterium]
MKRMMFLIGMVILTVLPMVVWGGTLGDAQKLYNDGRYSLAISVLDDLLKNNAQNADAAYWLKGKCYLAERDYYAAVDYLKQAVIRNPSKYADKISDELEQTATNILRYDGRNAKLLFDKAIEFAAPNQKNSLAKKIADNYVREGNGYLEAGYLDQADGFYDKALEFDFTARASFFYKIMDCGDIATDTVCAKYYALGAKYSMEEYNHLDDEEYFSLGTNTGTSSKAFNRGEKAGLRLKEIAHRIEQKDIFDPKVKEYRQVGGMFICLPIELEFNRGDNPLLCLKKGEITPWIGCNGVGTTEFRSNNSQYEIYHNNGEITRIWAGETDMPNFLKMYKIKAIEDTKVKLIFE